MHAWRSHHWPRDSALSRLSPFKGTRAIMATTQPMRPDVRGHTLSSEKFLTIAANLIHRGLLDSSRTDAKNLYRDLYAGKNVPLTQVRMEDESLVRFDLVLDYSEYNGTLSFGAFRTGIAVLIGNIGEALKKPESLRTFRNQQNSRAALFGVTALTVEGGETSVLALGADPAAAESTVQLQLMYLPSDQFLEAEGPDPVADPTSVA